MEKILLVGDDPTIVNLLKTILKGAFPNMVVDIAENGVRAMEMIDNPGDKAYGLVVVTTLRLSDIPSHEILEHLCKNHLGIKVLVVSGAAYQPAGCPMDAFLAKPFTREVFVQAVGQLALGT